MTKWLHRGKELLAHPGSTAPQTDLKTAREINVAVRQNTNSGNYGVYCTSLGWIHRVYQARTRAGELEVKINTGSWVKPGRVLALMGGQLWKLPSLTMAKHPPGSVQIACLPLPLRGDAMPMDLRKYPRNWKKVSRTIRRIAGEQCEWCDIPNGAPLPSGRPGRVVLTVAHIGAPYPGGLPGNKHDKSDVRRENLRALCQACHLRYDLEDHIRHAQETRQRKKRDALLSSGQLPFSF